MLTKLARSNLLLPHLASILPFCVVLKLFIVFLSMIVFLRLRLHYIGQLLRPHETILDRASVHT